MPLYDLETDHQSGFENAVRNGQTRLALEYAVIIINSMKSEIEGLKESIDTATTNTKSTSSSSRKEVKQTSEVSNV